MTGWQWEGSPFEGAHDLTAGIFDPEDDAQVQRTLHEAGLGSAPDRELEEDEVPRCELDTTDGRVCQSRLMQDGSCSRPWRHVRA